MRHGDPVEWNEGPGYPWLPARFNYEVDSRAHLFGVRLAPGTGRIITDWSVPKERIRLRGSK